MADKDYKAFIVEGKVREPQVIDNISKVFFTHGNFKVIALPAGENIYMLWKRLKADDFDTDILNQEYVENLKLALWQSRIWENTRRFLLHVLSIQISEIIILIPGKKS